MLLKWGDFELDEPRFELRKAGAVVQVQPKVLDLVLYLAKNRQRVVSKDELFDAVWKGIAVTEASLSQAVSLARRAVDDTPEEQHTIRTVRGKGFRFVGMVEPTAPVASPWSMPVSTPAATPRRPLAQQPLASSVAETQEEPAGRARAAGGSTMCLFVVAHCDLALLGGARYSLADVDEAVLTRGSSRRVERSGGITRVLEVHLPGHSISRDHAKLVRTRDGWLLSDEDSKNGTFVNEERVRRTSVKDGDFVRCGRTLLWLKSFELPDAMEPDADFQRGLESPFGTLMPELWALGSDLRRIAPSNLSVLISGPTGVGKERAARALHRASNRSGPVIVLDAGARAGISAQGETGLAGALRAAAGGTLIIEHIAEASAEDQATLVRVLDERSSRSDVRFITTTNRPLESLMQLERLRPDLLNRLSGFRCTIPGLAQRIGDFGCLLADIGSELGLTALDLDVAALTALIRHTWPENVRELRHALEVGTTLARGGQIKSEHLPPHLRAAS